MTFKVQIVNITDNLDNIILTSGLTIEKMKIKYNWVLNATVKNCILGEDENGLVWYSGEWICGEWINGTWYSGIWHDGTWYNGRWYSYLIDKAMIISNRFVILDKANTYSEFRSGLWKQGNFYNGTFGYDRDLTTGITYNDLTGRTFNCSYWLDGNFHDGIFKSSVWTNGLFYAGNMLNSYWLNGKFYSGTFNYHNPNGPINWYNGKWYGGDFVEGYWYNGDFEQINKTIPSRFGTANSSGTSTIWEDGNFYNGEFHSGLNINSSGVTIPSVNNKLTQWYNGNFKGGQWYGGHFNNGNWYNGVWYGGVFGNYSEYSQPALWYDGMWFNGLWAYGIFYDGHFYDGMWLNGQFINGYLSTNVVENPLLTQTIATNILLPSVTAYTITSIESNKAIANCGVSNNGGAIILDRGICWSTNQYPLISDDHISDNGSTGSYSIQMTSLLINTLYYVRAYATNITGTTYSNELSFTTLSVSDYVPQVRTYDPNSITSSSATINARITSSYEQVNYCGFYFSETNIEPTSSDTIFYGIVPSGINGVGTFFVNLTGLTESTPYYYKSWAESNNGIGTGDTMSFTTIRYYPPVACAVETVDVIAISISDTSAIAQGKVTFEGYDIITSAGVCWSTSVDPTIIDNSGETNYTLNIPYNINITGLSPLTTYHVRAFATNSIGTSYGSDLSFTTKDVPTVAIISVEPI